MLLSNHLLKALEPSLQAPLLLLCQHFERMLCTSA